MAGYLGSKAVLLSTTAATVTGNATVGGSLTAASATVSGDLTVDTDTLYVDSTNNRVGIGTTSPQSELDIKSDEPEVWLTDSTDNSYTRLRYNGGTFFVEVDDSNSSADSSFRIQVDGSEAARLDSSGNLLVGTTDINPQSSSTETGLSLRGSIGFLGVSRSSAQCAAFNRLSTDGDIVELRKDGTTVGQIATNGGVLHIGSSSTNLRFQNADNSIRPSFASGSNRDNIIDLGASSARFDNIYATNGTIQTSDRNEKQDIAELDKAEKRVAVACKGLIRKYRWKDAVAEKGDAARIHVGIIAQDLQDAFAAEGLDAHDYAMFISATWWEAEEVIPAVEEVLDDEGNVVTEAQPERTVTKTYETAEEAPEGAVEKTRLGVRYPELLAFIIGAM